MPKNQLYPEMKATPRNRLSGLLADALTGVRDFADQVKVPDSVPLVGGQGVGSMFLMKAPEEINELSYGNLPIQINPYAGRTANFVPEMKRGRGQQVADAISLLSLPGAKTVAGGLLGMPGADAAMFIGSKAKTWDAAAAARAIELEKAGVPAPSIWSETGTLRGPDGLLRQEIDDSAARMNLGALPRFAGTDAQSGRVANVLRNKPLDAAYPDLGMVDLSANPANMTSASYMEGGKLIPENIALNRPTRFSLRNEIPGQKEVTKESLTDSWFLQNFGGDQAKLDAWTNQQLAELSRKEDYLKRGYAPDRGAKSDLLHELQHAIQRREGFARGGSMDEFVREAMKPQQQAMERIRGINEEMKKAVGTPRYQALMDERQSLVPLAQKDILDVREEAFKFYQRLAGEAEARATQARMNMTPVERRATFPLDSYDVPINQLIIR